MKKDLPARPNVEHLKSQAKDLLDAYRRGDEDALARFRESLPSAHGATDEAIIAMGLALHDAQSVIAREYGFESFAELRTNVESVAVRSLMAAHPNAPLPYQVLEAMSATAAAKPKPPAIIRATSLPAIPLRGAMLMTGALAPISIGRPSSIAAADAARHAGDRIAVFSQKVAATEAPAEKDLYSIGCVAQIVSTVEGGPHGTFLVLRGCQWVTLEVLERSEPYLLARVVPFDVHASEAKDVGRLESLLRAKVVAIVATLPGAERLREMVDHMDPLELADATIANLPCSLDDKARYANESSVAARLERALALVEA